MGEPGAGRFGTVQVRTGQVKTIQAGQVRTGKVCTGQNGKVLLGARVWPYSVLLVLGISLFNDFW